MKAVQIKNAAIDATLVIVLSVLYSLIEIELEAGCGWGVNIPTSQVMKSSLHLLPLIHAVVLSCNVYRYLVVEV